MLNERPLLQLLDQLFLDVGGSATYEGVLGLAVVEGHLSLSSVPKSFKSKP